MMVNIPYMEHMGYYLFQWDYCSKIGASMHFNTKHDQFSGPLGGSVRSSCCWTWHLFHFNFMMDGPSFYDMCSIGKGKIMIDQPQKLQFQQVWVGTQLDDPPWDCGCLIFRQRHVMGRVCWSCSSWLALKCFKAVISTAMRSCTLCRSSLEVMWVCSRKSTGAHSNDPKWLFFYSIWNITLWWTNIAMENHHF